MATTQPIRSKGQIRELAGYYMRKGQLRNYVLVTLGIETALRISDLLSLKWDDVYDFERGQPRKHLHLTEKKTKKSKCVALSNSVKSALSLLTAVRGGAIIANFRTGKAISRIQAYRIIRAACEALKFTVRVSCHSLRKTFGYHAWKNGAPVAIIMEIYNHDSFATTRRYLGVTQDEKDLLHLTIELMA